MKYDDAGPGRAFKLVTVLLVLLGLILLGWGLTHKSSEPQLFERYSYSYALLLVAVASGTAFLALLLRFPNPRLVWWTANLYTFGVSTILIVGITEIGLRLFNPWGVQFFHALPFHMQGMVDDRELGYAHPSSVSYELIGKSVALNSHGLRDTEIAYDKPEGEKRVLVLGDSTTFGWGVSQGEPFRI